MKTRTDARKKKLGTTDVWELLHDAKKITVAKGTRIEIFAPNLASKEAILKTVTGRTGNLRAPTVQIADVFFVGFNEALYTEIKDFKGV